MPHCLRPLVCLLFLAILAVSATPCAAGQVQAEEPLAAEAAPATARQSLTDKAFAQAVQAEAQSLLPQSLDPRRLDLLRDYLGRRGGRFIQSYKELSLEAGSGTARITLDVTVNRDELLKHLQRLGIAHTADGNLRGVSLSTAGLLPADRQAVDRLMVLSGLRAETGVWPELVVERAGAAMFAGQVKTQERSWPARDKDLETLWFELVSRVFSVQEVKPQALSGARLEVSGWASPDGVQEFDRTLKGWEAEVSAVVLQGMTLQAGGVTATWNVKVLNKGGLEARLKEYLPQHGLKHAFP